jgi:hypothetical protein
MMDEQLVQNQTIEALRRQVEASNNSAQQAQALLRSNQEQQLQHSRMLPRTTYQQYSFYATLVDSIDGAAHQRASWSGYYHIGSPADQGFAEQMRATYGRDEMDPPRQEPPRQDTQSCGSHDPMGLPCR